MTQKYELEWPWIDPPEPDIDEPTKLDMKRAIQLAFWVLHDEVIENDYEQELAGARNRHTFFYWWCSQQIKDWCIDPDLDDPFIGETQKMFDEYMKGDDPWI